MAWMEHLEDLKALLSVPKDIVITTHRNPDGDAIGASLALYHYLNQFGHTVKVMAPSEYPDFLSWMPGAQDILIFDVHTEKGTEWLKRADIIFVLDYNDLERVDRMGEIIAPLTCVKVMIDHHLYPEPFADYVLSDTSASSTCELIYDFLGMLGHLNRIDLRVGDSIFTGILTDTGSFKYSTSPKLFRIVADLIGDRRLLPLYLLSGLAGGFLYIATAHWIYKDGGYAYGASGAVMGIVVASGLLAPDYLIRLIIFGEVRLKYIVIFLLLLDVIGLANMSNTGGHIAHLGGAVMGFFFIRLLQEGRDWSVPVNRIIDGISDYFHRLFGGRSRPKVVYRSPDLRKEKEKVKSTGSKGWGQRSKGSGATDQSHQERLDAILDKIKQSGYESLTAEEKDFLFNASKKHE